MIKKKHFDVLEFFSDIFHGFGHPSYFLQYSSIRGGSRESRLFSEKKIENFSDEKMFRRQKNFFLMIFDFLEISMSELLRNNISSFVGQ